MLKQNQKDAIKKLEQALLSCKRAGLAMVGVDDNLHITVDDEDLVREVGESSHTQAMLQRSNIDHPDHHRVKHYGVYRDSGAT